MRKHSYRGAARQKRRFPRRFFVVSSIIGRRFIAGTTQNPNTILSAIFLVFNIWNNGHRRTKQIAMAEPGARHCNIKSP
jgi:hypothetical protein